MLVLMHSASRAHYLHCPAQRYGSGTSLVLAILLDVALVCAHAGYLSSGWFGVGGDTVRLLAIFAM